MLISFWSSHHGQSGATSNLIALSLAISLNKKLKVMVSHLQNGESQLERALVSDIDNYISSTLCNYGIEPVLRLAKNGLLNVDNFSDYTIPLLNNNGYDLLAGMRKNALGKQEKEKQECIISEILEISKNKYDMVFVDLPSGFLNDLSKKIIEISDVVVINISQNYYTLESLKNSEFINDISHKAIYCIGKYDDRTKSNIKNISRKYKLKKVIKVPYEPQFVDVMNRGEILELFGRNLAGKGNKKNSNFFKDIMKSSEDLIKFTNERKNNKAI